MLCRRAFGGFVVASPSLQGGPPSSPLIVVRTTTMASGADDGILRGRHRRRPIVASSVVAGVLSAAIAVDCLAVACGRRAMVVL